MASKAAPQDRFDATKRQPDSIPSYVRVPTGEVEVDSQGELVLDADDEPVFKSQAFLVRRTGEALKSILKSEIELTSQHARQQEEEDEAFAKEDEEGGEKVDIAWLTQRQQERTQQQIDLTYSSLAQLLVSPADSTHPDPKELSKVLDYVTAAEWMRVIVPPVEVVGDGEAATTESPIEAGSGTAPGAGS